MMQDATQHKNITTMTSTDFKLIRTSFYNKNVPPKLQYMYGVAQINVSQCLWYILTQTTTVDIMITNMKTSRNWDLNKVLNKMISSHHHINTSYEFSNTLWNMSMLIIYHLRFEAILPSFQTNYDRRPQNLYSGNAFKWM